MRTIDQTADLLSQIPRDPPMNRRTMHTQSRRDLGDLSTSEHRPHRVQPLLNNRQDNQSHPGLP